MVLTCIRRSFGILYDARRETRILLANLKTKKTKKKKKDNMIYDHINIVFRMSIKIKILIFFTFYLKYKNDLMKFRFIVPMRLMKFVLFNLLNKY